MVIQRNIQGRFNTFPAAEKLRGKKQGDGFIWWDWGSWFSVHSLLLASESLVVLIVKARVGIPCLLCEFRSASYFCLEHSLAGQPGLHCASMVAVWDWIPDQLWLFCAWFIPCNSLAVGWMATLPITCQSRGGTLSSGYLLLDTSAPHMVKLFGKVDWAPSSPCCSICVEFWMCFERKTMGAQLLHSAWGFHNKSCFQSFNI